MELLSILNPPITDQFNDPPLTSENLLKLIDDQQKTITQQVKELAVQVKKDELTPFDVMMFACLQHHLQTLWQEARRKRDRSSNLGAFAADVSKTSF